MPLSSLYGVLTDLRNRLYDRNVFSSHSLGARTLSVGNITAGGTGKTPLVAYIARLLAETGETVCILTRGYGRRDANDRVLVSDGESVLSEPELAGDEPVELAHRLLGHAIVVADADRVSAAEWARRKFGVTAFILDDGFQHRRARRDVDIVCIDATDPFGGGKMLPAGRLREPLHNLSRADVVVITRADLSENIEDLKFQISELNPEVKIYSARNKIFRVSKLSDFHVGTHNNRTGVSSEQPWMDAIETADAGRKIGITAFCGLGNPENFFRQISNAFAETERFDPLLRKAFPDHHKYTQRDIDALESTAKDNGISAMLTTAKDAVKLKGLDITVPCFVVEIEVVVDDPNGFAELL
jgi:tetraacyldisaccharide 4'-kinase